MDRRGAPAARRGRPRTRSLTSWAPPITSVARAITAHAVGEPTTTAHTAMAAQASSAPGSTGTTTPTIPVAIARATTTRPRSLIACLGLWREAPGHLHGRHRDARHV